MSGACDHVPGEKRIAGSIGGLTGMKKTTCVVWKDGSILGPIGDISFLGARHFTKIGHAVGALGHFLNSKPLKVVPVYIFFEPFVAPAVGSSGLGVMVARCS